MVTDSVADLLTRVRNAQRAGHKTVSIPMSKLNKAILEVFRSEGYVGSVDVVKAEGDQRFDTIRVYLKYDDIGRPAITEIKRISKPGRRVYLTKDKLPKVRSGLGVAFISTSQGVVTDREARKRGIGGEILASIF
ncbi:MAG: 30S ribosomal protein S8 [Bdellovibrionales bacterium]|nr:30S ribosomal protein S8 [Bdellovibrionales bacterium]